MIHDVHGLVGYTIMNSIRLISKLAESAISIMPAAGEKIYLVMISVYRMLPIRVELKISLAKRVLADSGFLRNFMMSSMSRRVGRQVLREQALFLQQGATSKASRRHRAMIVEHRIPMPDMSSGSVRLAAMLKLIREEGWDIVFVSDTDKKNYQWFLKDIKSELPKYENELTRFGITFFYGFDAAKLILDEVGASFDLVILSYPEIMHKYAPLVRAYAPLTHLAYDTVDLHSLRFSREVEIKTGDVTLVAKANYYKSIERAALRVADTVIAITHDESKQIATYCEAVEQIIIPNIHSVSDGYSVNSYEARNGLLFIGQYIHTPNEDAACHFVRDIYPLIEAQERGIEFTMLGSTMTGNVQALATDSIHAVGFVEDPDPYFARARVFVAPLRYGAGMKGKIGQALSLGIPIVTTSIGAEGMGLVDGLHVLIADDPHAFSTAVIRLYRDKDLWNRLSSAGREHILKHFSESATKPAIAALLKRAVDHKTAISTNYECA